MEIITRPTLPVCLTPAISPPAVVRCITCLSLMCKGLRPPAGLPEAPPLVMVLKPRPRLAVTSPREIGHSAILMILIGAPKMEPSRFIPKQPSTLGTAQLPRFFLRRRPRLRPGLMPLPPKVIQPILSALPPPNRPKPCQVITSGSNTILTSLTRPVLVT